MFMSSSRPIIQGLKALLFLLATCAVAVDAAKVDLSSVPWDDLRALLGSSPDDLLTLNFPLDKAKDAWMEQCVPVFANMSFPYDSYRLTAFISTVGSNYQLIDQPNGLCADVFSCAWKYCDWQPTEIYTINEDNPAASSLQDYFEPDKVEDHAWNLPAAVVHPRTVGDIIHALHFAKNHSLGMSVKTSGHSYVGASTDKDSLSINMRTYVKYATPNVDDDGSGEFLLECNNAVPLPSSLSLMNDTTSEYTTNELRAQACQVAMSRNKSAIARVGGGQIWDESYRSVSAWNSRRQEEGGSAKYHIVGGGAGTVSSTGGYLGCTGLSGTTGMRLFGYAVDQVTQMEMVLPSGQHVRFGPTDWEDDTSLAFPRTTRVSGWCNTNPHAANEAEWKWQVCSPNQGSSLFFDDLWHAVRGGGNGYGIITAVEYQLQDYPGKFSMLAQQLPANFTQMAIASCGACQEAFAIVEDLWINFLIDIGWNPQAVNVSEQDSALCGGTEMLSPLFNKTTAALCYGNGGDVWAEAWKRTMTANASVQESLINAGMNQELMDAVTNMLIPNSTGFIEDYASFLLGAPQSGAPQSPGVPSGRLVDSPPPATTYSFSRNSMLIPKKFLIEHRDVSVPWMKAWGQLGTGIYMMGGHIAQYHDGTTATNQLYREAAFWGDIARRDDIPELVFLIKALLEYYNGVEGIPQEKYPGGGEYNHMQTYGNGPLKTNWSEPCPLPSKKFPRAKRDEMCISLLENVFGTDGLARLESIKAAVDPTHLFNSFGTVGYREEEEEGVEAPGAVGPTEAPATVSPPPAPTDGGEDDEPMSSSDTAGLLVISSASVAAVLLGVIMLISY